MTQRQKGRKKKGGSFSGEITWNLYDINERRIKSPTRQKNNAHRFKKRQYN